MIVILERGARGEKRFPEESEARATQRAEALAELHRCKLSVAANTIRVHASEWYGKE